MSEMIGEGYATTGEVKGLCSKCKFFNLRDPITNCFRNNTYKEFAKRWKIIVIVAECKKFKDKEAVEEVKVIPGHEFENDVMKVKERANYEEEDMPPPEELPSEKDKDNENEDYIGELIEIQEEAKARKDKEKQELKEKGGNDADHRTE